VSEGSGHEGLWTEPRYPGDTVRILMLYRATTPGRYELGDIRIQHIRQDLAKVGAFLPGETECSPGDTPKTWPEKSETATSSFAADALFDKYVQEAYADGWQNYHPEQHGGLRG
jgi:hypothetical protein